MSTYAYAKLSTTRDQQPPGESTRDKPPGVATYVDILAGLVPAEVLTIHALVISGVTTAEQGATKINDEGALVLGFWGLMVLSVVIFAAGHVGRKWKFLDLPRAFIAPTAFWAWTMLQPVSAFDAVASWSTGIRLVLGALAAAMLAALAGIVAVRSDKNPPS
jgi:hypothetical protein